MATAAAELKYHGLALAVLSRSADKNPQVPDTWFQLGQFKRQIQDCQGARECYDRALQLKCSDNLRMHIYTGIGGSYINQGEPEKAEKWVRRALDIQPDFWHARNALALSLLEQCKWQDGWKEYAERWRLPGYQVRDYPGVPQWDGTKVKDTLIIHAEQGLGDEILFASCIPDLRPLADKILGECQGRLIELFRRSFPYVTWYPTPETLRVSDEYLALFGENSAWYRMGDLPMMFRAAPESCPGTPFLKADPVKVAGYKARLNALGPGPHVGFSWRGGTAGTHEKVRNAPLDHWRSLIEACPGTPVSVQYGKGEKLCTHWPSAIDDLDEFAALIAALDLVVSVCGASVHFAGGLGIPCWVPTPKECAWRYAGTDESMPWYKSVRLFRGSWDASFPKIMTCLKSL